MKKNTMQLFLLLAFTVVFVFALCSSFVSATPVGIQVTSNTSSTATTVTTSRADEGGTIVTTLFNVSQQTDAWKGYVGNVTGNIALRDSSNYSLYDWVLTSISGEIYASRASSITWTTLNCSTPTVVAAEYAAINMVDSDADSINKTFNGSLHSALTVAGKTIAANTCNATATYVNNSAQNVSATSYFQEILLNDTSNLVYATIINNDIGGYHTGYIHDFQMIVPDSDAASTQTTYYFWAELN
jgi:hypothetical protein